MHRIAHLFKATSPHDEGQEFRLTNFDVQEVSVVDQAANQEDWLVIKGINIMSVRALQELLTSKGVGEFMTKDGDDAGGDAPAAGAGAGGDASSKLRLSQAKKDESVQGIATVIKALVEVAKAIEGAEVDEASTTLPAQLNTVITSASQALAKIGGASGEAPADDAGKRNSTSKKVDEFEASLDTLGGLLANLRGALGGEAPANGGDAAPGGAGDVLAAAADPAIAKALGDLTALVKRQSGEITTLKSKLGLPAAASAEGNVETRSDGDFAWPMDMNEDRRRSRAAR